MRKKLLEISTQIATTLDEARLTRLLAEGLAALIRYDTMTIYVADHTQRFLVPTVIQGPTWGEADGSKWTIPFGRGILGHVIEQGQAERIDDAHLDSRAVFPEGFNPSQEQMIAIPLGLGEHRWGAFAINRMSGEHFNDDEFETAQFLASYASLALNNIKLLREVHETNELKQVILETISDAVITVDQTGTIIYCNESTEKVFGYTPEELLGRPLRMIVPEQLHAAHRQGFERYLQTGVRGLPNWSSLELPGQHKNGSLVPVEVSFGETRSAGKRVFSAIIRDITQRKAAEEALKSTSKRLENLILTIQAGVLVEDENRQIVLVNGVFCEMFGVPGRPEDMTGIDCAGPLDQSKVLFADPEGFIRRVTDLLLARQIVVGEELALADGRTFARDYVPIFVEELHRGHMWLYRDVTSAKKIEMDLIHSKLLAEESMRAKQDFLAKMSHELRTPINGVLGLTNLIATSLLSRENQEYLKGIKTSGEHLLAIINDILDLAKIEAGKLRLDHIDFRPAEIVKALVQSQQVIALNKNLKLSREYDEKIPAVLVGDPLRLNQILLNLVSNAIKYTERGGVKISFRMLDLKADETTLAIEVSDTGIGIPADKLQAIFESFNQGDRNTGIKYGGTGLGLTIVKQLVELQNGRVEVYSTPNEGSRFLVVLTFPVSHNVQDHPQEQNWEELYYFSDARVLLVEDNLINQTVARKTMEKWGVTVEIASNGKEALEKIKSTAYDLVIMDIQMPEMDGFEATRIIRHEFPEPLCRIPIMAMTASVLYDAIERCKAAGMNEYISKPFDYRDMNTKLSRFLKHEKKGEEQEAHEQQDTHIDFKYLELISPGNTAFHLEMINLFDTQSASYLADIKESFVKGDYDAMKWQAHAFKPLGSYIGINSLSTMIMQLESLAEAGKDVDAIAVLIAQIEVLLDSIHKEIEWIRTIRVG